MRFAYTGYFGVYYMTIPAVVHGSQGGGTKYSIVVIESACLTRAGGTANHTTRLLNVFFPLPALCLRANSDSI